jgi:poly(A) polymerase
LQLVRAVDDGQAQAIAMDVRNLEATPGGIAPKPVLTGDELVARGCRPGPAFRQALDQAYDAQLEGRVRTLEEAWELVRKLVV